MQPTAVAQLTSQNVHETHTIWPAFALVTTAVNCNTFFFLSCCLLLLLLVWNSKRWHCSHVKLQSLTAALYWWEGVKSAVRCLILKATSPPLFCRQQSWKSVIFWTYITSHFWLLSDVIKEHLGIAGGKKKKRTDQIDHSFSKNGQLLKVIRSGPLAF